MDVIEFKWGNPTVVGERKAEKPDLVAFKNSFLAIEMLNRHVRMRDKIAIHCDVDVDGIGSGYIIGTFIQNRMGGNPYYLINKEKEHGIKQKYVDYFKDKELGLLIIVDSSSNDIDIIKQFNCDVIVIDHHSVSHNELYGETFDGKHKFIIVNNTIKNEGLDEIETLSEKNLMSAVEKINRHNGDDRMSCGLVVYELLRIYCYAFDLGELLENLRLYQWAGITLFTDSIALNTERNQWYVENTVHTNEVENNIKRILDVVNPFRTSLDKSIINYKIAPIINKAIRAGASGEALRAVILSPDKIRELEKYKDKQEKALSEGVRDAEVFESYVEKDLSETDISPNYNGVIASKLCSENKKNAIVYRVMDGIAQGSFRGRVQEVDYRKFIDEYSEDCYAQGHRTSFGFKIPLDKLDSIMRELVTLEGDIDSRPLLTAGRLNEQNPGKFTIDSIDKFKREGGIWKIGIGNSKVSSDEQILLTVSSSDAVLEEVKGQLYIYNILGLQCKAFKPIQKQIIDIYIEFSNQIDCYVRE